MRRQVLEESPEVARGVVAETMGTLAVAEKVAVPAAEAVELAEALVAEVALRWVDWDC